VPFVTVHELVAGVGGAPDDVEIIASAMPVKASLLWSSLRPTAGGGGGETVTLRTAAGGLGNALSGAMIADPADATPLSGAPQSGVEPNTVAAGASVYARRSDSDIAGELICCWCRRS
jgi:hypothetical protein